MSSDPIGGGQVGPTGDSGRGETAASQQPIRPRRKWYQARLLEPFLGMVLGFLLVVFLAGFLGAPVAALMQTITGSFGGIGGEAMPGEARTDGTALFARYCATCHGEQGEKMPNADLTSDSIASGHSELAIAKIIGEGRGAMPAFGRSRGGPLDDKQVRATAAFVRTLSTVGSTSVSAVQTATPNPQQSGVPTPIATAIRPTPRPTEAIPTPKVPTPKPTPIIDKQPAINDQYVGVVQHVDGWFGQHSAYVRTYGASLCFRCHGATACAECHYGRVW